MNRVAPISVPTSFCDAADGLISIDEACARVASYASPINEHENVPVSDAVVRTLAQPITARIALPPFDRSAMDGYALAAGDGLPVGSILPVAGRVAAGEGRQILPPGNTLRILAGAMIPDGADAVIMQENVSRMEQINTILRSPETFQFHNRTATFEAGERGEI